MCCAIAKIEKEALHTLTTNKRKIALIPAVLHSKAVFVVCSGGSGCDRDAGGACGCVLYPYTTTVFVVCSGGGGCNGDAGGACGCVFCITPGDESSRNVFPEYAPGTWQTSRGAFLRVH